jgi:hypothetical protein
MTFIFSFFWVGGGGGRVVQSLNISIEGGLVIFERLDNILVNYYNI